MIKIKNGRYEIAGFALDINIDIQAGTFCAVLGPSGAGKSTLLSIISGFENLKSGEVIFNDVQAAASPSARPISMIFQDHNVFAHLDVWNNVALGISPNLKLNDQQKFHVENALARVGIAHLAKRKPDEISGGERQRIAIARVLVRNQPILLLDEPFAALDPGLRIDMLNLITELQREKNLTVLMVTHQPDDAKYAAQKIIFISDGNVQEGISTNEFFRSQNFAVLKYLGKRR